MNPEKAVLVNSPRELSPLLPRSTDKRMPLGLMYISAFLKSNGLDCKVVDAEALGLGIPDILRIINDETPCLVGLNCHTLNRYTVYEIARTIRFFMPNVLIVLGGAHPGLAPELTFQECPDIDAIVSGEGEKVCLQLMQNSDSLINIPGLYLMRDGKMISTGLAPRIQNLDILPFPDLDDVPIEEFLSFEDPHLPGLWQRAYISASRGCRYRCSFCTEWSHWRSTTTFRSANNVVEEINNYRKKFNLDRFYFYDDTFTDWPDFQKFCSIASRLDIFWSCSTRIDHLSHSNVKILANGGCREVAVGLESGSDQSLKNMRKQWEQEVEVTSVGDRLQMCFDYGIVPRAHFMIGFPWESREHINATVRFALSLKQHSLQDANFFSVKAYPGTSLYTQLTKHTTPSNEEIRWADAWSVYDWDSTDNPKAAAKLRRFNDISRPSLHPHLSSLAIRRLTRNAWELFFSDAGVKDVEEHLWRGVSWEEQATA